MLYNEITFVSTIKYNRLYRFSYIFFISSQFVRYSIRRLSSVIVKVM